MKHCKIQISHLGARLPVLGRRACDERGQAVIEFLVILPVFLALVFGMIEFGKGFSYWIDVTHLASEGGRYASVDRWPDCPATDPPPGVPGSDCAPTTTLQAYIISRTDTSELATGDAGKGEVPNALTVNYCRPGLTANVGDPIRVTVSSRYEFPVVNGLLKLVGASALGVNLAARSTIRLERIPTRLGVIPAC